MKQNLKQKVNHMFIYTYMYANIYMHKLNNVSKEDDGMN